MASYTAEVRSQVQDQLALEGQHVAAAPRVCSHTFIERLPYSRAPRERLALGTGGERKHSAVQGREVPREQGQPTM